MDKFRDLLTESKGLALIRMDIDVMYDIDMDKAGKEGKDWDYGTAADKSGSDYGDYKIYNSKTLKKAEDLAKKEKIKVQTSGADSL